jgi:hypothetical protein
LASVFKGSGSGCVRASASPKLLLLFCLILLGFRSECGEGGGQDGAREERGGELGGPFRFHIAPTK